MQGHGIPKHSNFCWFADDPPRPLSLLSYRFKLETPLSMGLRGKWELAKNKGCMTVIFLVATSLATSFVTSLIREDYVFVFICIFIRTTRIYKVLVYENLKKVWNFSLRSLSSKSSRDEYCKSTTHFNCTLKKRPSKHTIMQLKEIIQCCIFISMD